MKSLAKLIGLLLLVIYILIVLFLFLMSFDSPGSMSSVGAWLMRIGILVSPLIFFLPNNKPARVIQVMGILSLVFLVLFCVYESERVQNKIQLSEIESKANLSGGTLAKTKGTNKSAKESSAVTSRVQKIKN